MTDTHRQPLARPVGGNDAHREFLEAVADVPGFAILGQGMGTWPAEREG